MEPCEVSWISCTVFYVQGVSYKPCKVSWISCTVFYVQGVNYETLQSILDFMYQGEVMVCRDNLNSFLRLAKELEVKKLTLCHKLVFSKPFICATWLCKPFIFLTQNSCSNRIHSLKCLRYTTLGCMRNRV